MPFKSFAHQFCFHTKVFKIIYFRGKHAPYPVQHAHIHVFEVKHLLLTWEYFLTDCHFFYLVLIYHVYIFPKECSNAAILIVSYTIEHFIDFICWNTQAFRVPSCKARCVTVILWPFQKPKQFFSMKFIHTVIMKVILKSYFCCSRSRCYETVKVFFFYTPQFSHNVLKYWL